MKKIAWVVLCLLAVVVAFWSGGVFLLVSSQSLIGVSTENITLRMDETTVFYADLGYRPWTWAWNLNKGMHVVRGTIKILTPTTTVYQVNPSQVDTTNTTGPFAEFTVTGVSSGTGTITVTGTSTYGKHNPTTISITATP
jgi:hypothetical protein